MMSRHILLATFFVLVGCEAGEPNSLPVEDSGADTATQPQDVASTIDISGAGTSGDDAGVEEDISVEEDTSIQEDTGAEEDTTVGPEPSCASDSDCDDGLSCTDDTCVDGACSWALSDGNCLISNVCFAADAEALGVACKVCNPELDAYGWSDAADGATCDDGDACTEEDVCTAAVCAGSAITCDTAEQCSAAICDSTIGCIVVAGQEGEACDDGAVCTEGDTCTSGVCVGALVVCDDGEQCTEDACDPEAGCVYNWMLEAVCDDGDPCTGGDTCGETACESGTADGCDDGNGCTIDLCEPGLGCGHIPLQSPCCLGETSVCDDANACTIDTCDIVTQDCSYETLEEGLGCDDGDACTSATVCTAGACVGVTLDCDDGNSCTTDSCDSETGECVYEALSGVPCDDGLPCSVGDACLAGQCVADKANCSCEPASFGDTVKMVTLAIGDGGAVGQGLDVDGDPTTCAPSNDCSDGIDNAFSVMGAFMNASLVESIAAGDVMLMSEFAENNTKLIFHQAQLDPANPSCDFMSQTCDYVVALNGYNPDTCVPLIEMDVTMNGTTFTAGGPGSTLNFQAPFAGVTIELPMYDVKLTGEVTYQDGKIVGISGLMGGAIEKTSLLASIDAMPDEGLPVPKSSIKTILDLTLEYDIDTTGDGTKDGASIGFPFSAISANITGVWE